jgi:hypothetical protein
VPHGFLLAARNDADNPRDGWPGDSGRVQQELIVETRLEQHTGAQRAPRRERVLSRRVVRRQNLFEVATANRLAPLRKMLHAIALRGVAWQHRERSTQALSTFA